MKIPIKKYEPRKEALKMMQQVLQGDLDFGPEMRLLSEELRDLLRHHGEETTWLIQRIKELELLSKD